MMEMTLNNKPRLSEDGEGSPPVGGSSNQLREARGYRQRAQTSLHGS